MDFRKRFAVPPDGKFKLADIDPAYKGEHENHQSAAPEIVRNTEALAHLQYKLYAEGRRSLLLILQGLDASGKDGVIRHIFNSINPQGVNVTCFKQPTHEELAHDFLWRAPAMRQPSAAKNAAMSLQTAACTAGSRTMPFLIAARAASNCGLISEITRRRRSCPRSTYPCDRTACHPRNSTQSFRGACIVRAPAQHSANIGSRATSKVDQSRYHALVRCTLNVRRKNNLGNVARCRALLELVHLTNIHAR